mgnify:CR=1 FL=1
MSKNLLTKIVNDEDLHHIALNAFTAWGAGTFGNIFSNSILKFNFNQYNSTNHFTVGVIFGTLMYRLKKIGIGLAALTALNFGFEIFENGYVFGDIRGLGSLDTITDVAVLYAGVALSFLGERAKEYLNNNRTKRDRKISMVNLIESSRERYKSKIDRFYENLCKR